MAHNLALNPASRHPGKNIRSNPAKLQARLKNIFSQHLMALRISFRNVVTTPLTTFITLIAIGVSLAIPIGCFLIVFHMAKVGQYWEHGASISLYLKENVAESDRQSLMNDLNSTVEIREVTFQTKDEALDEFKEKSGLADVVSLLDKNPLTDVVTVYPHNHAKTPEEINNLYQSLKHLPQVQEAVLDHEWVEKFNAVVTFGKKLSFILGTIIGLGVIVIVGNTVRLALEKHRDEIEVLTLIGATYAFIRRPFLYRGMWYSVVGGLLALMLISFSSSLLTESLATLSELFGTSIHLNILHLPLIAAVMIVSALLGWLGAWLAVKGILREQTCR